MPTQPLTYTKLADRDVSFSLIRTNPKLTSNVKLTVDSKGSLWLNSIDAVSELTQKKYKRFAVDPNSSHEVNLFKFYDTGKTPSKISFALGSTVRTDVIAKDLKDQYDFDLYSSGAKYLSTNDYSEKFTYFAPLYLETIIPEYFVIFKIPGASNYTVGEWQQKVADPTFNQLNFAVDLFKHATIVKTVSLKEGTGIGNYIRGILANRMYPKYPLYVNFKDSSYSIYRGASIRAGAYVEIPEMLDSTFKLALPQLKLEKYITGGFERNNIVYPKILNLEFLFNDETAGDYEFNRYLGFYCNAIDLVQFDLDLDRMFDNPLDNDNPLPFKFKQSDDVTLSLTNPNGVVLRGTNVNSQITDINNALSDKDHLFFPYLRTKSENLHFIKIKHDDPNDDTLTQIGNTIKFAVDDTQFDIGMAFGVGDRVSQEIAQPFNKSTRSTVAVTFDKAPDHLDRLRLYTRTGSTYLRSDLGGRFDDLVFVSGYFTNNEEYSLEYPQVYTVSIDTADPNNGGTVFTPNTPTAYETEYVSAVNGTRWIWNGNAYEQGALGSRIYINLDNANLSTTPVGTFLTTDLSKLAKTVVKVVKALDNTISTGLSFQNTSFLQVRAFGNMYGQLGVKSIESTSSQNYPKIKINGSAQTSIVYADGGGESVNQAIIPSANINRLTPLLDKVVVKTKTDWAKIIRVANSSYLMPTTGDSLTKLQSSSYFSYATLMLENNESIDVEYSKIDVRELFKPSIGVLSLFDIKDINFDTYSTEYSRTSDIDFYQYYYVPANTQILDFTKYTYLMVGNGTIKINNQVFSTRDITSSASLNVWQPIRGLHSYSILEGNVILAYSNAINRTSLIRRDIPYLDEDNNLKDFTGFFSLGADHSEPNSSSPTYEYREKYKPNSLLSEYHVYLENFSTEFSTEGRVVPYISKWGAVNSTDARGNAYRLNSDLIFGKDNFGPSHRETIPTSEKLTHEWYYIESDFNYSLAENLASQNYYYFNDPINLTALIQDATYFEKYFTYVPRIDGNEINRPQLRYSKLVKDEFSNQYTTIFKGAKFIFSELDQAGKILESTDRFEDYNFSVLLKPVKENLIQGQSPVSYQIIENTNSKSILVLVTVALGHIGQINPRLLTQSSTIDSNQIDQTSIFCDFNNQAAGSRLLTSLAPAQYQITAIYTTTNDGAGDSEFIGLYADSPVDLANLAGDAIDPLTGDPIASFYPKDGDTILVVKGSDTTQQFIMAVRGSDIYTDATEYTLLTGSENFEANPLIEYTLETVASFAVNDVVTDLTSGAKGLVISDDGSTLQVRITTQNREFGIGHSLINGSGAVATISHYAPQYLVVSPSSDCFLFNSLSRIVRIHTSQVIASSDTEELPLALGRLFKVIKRTPQFLSVFGDYRISFNQNGVSNLCHAFLYAAKDKKYNSNKSAFSTVKLAVGIDLSNVTNLSTVGQKLDGVPSSAFKVEDFINPISGSHDKLMNSPVDSRVSAPLPAFAPVMAILKNGDVYIGVKSSSPINSNTYSDLNINLDLGNPSTTSDLIDKTRGNVLYFEKNDVAQDISSVLYTTLPSPDYLDLTTVYDSQTVYVAIPVTQIGSRNLPPAFKVGDIVTATANSLAASFTGEVVSPITLGSVLYNGGLNLPLTATNPTDPLDTNTNGGLDNWVIPIKVRSTDTGAATGEELWTLVSNRIGHIIKPSLIIQGDGPILKVTTSGFPAGFTSTWLDQSQQFQLFGGKNYFSNLFENISFANFIKILEVGSPILSWETYTDGVKQTGQKISIRVEPADQLIKSQIVKLEPEEVETSSRVEVGGVIHAASLSREYDMSRYSTEYDVLYRPVSGFKYETRINDFDLSGANVMINPTIRDLFVLPEFSYVKYSKDQILDLESSQKFKAVYPLINESPIDFGSYNFLSSSWDFNYHNEYVNKNTKSKIPGSRRIVEDYSFVSKLLNLPLTFTAESFNVVQLSNKNFEITDQEFQNLKANGSSVDIAYSVYTAEVKFKINLKQIIAKTIIEAGLRSEFEKFFVDQSSQVLTSDPITLGDLTLDQYLTEYTLSNLVKLYELDTFEFYEKPDHTLADNSINITQVDYADLDDLEYSLVKGIKINNTKAAVLNGSIIKKASTGISLVPKLKIKYT